MWKWRLGDFLGCPVGKTLCFHCRELRSQMLCIVAKKKKKKKVGGRGWDYAVKNQGICEGTRIWKGQGRILPYRLRSEYGPATPRFRLLASRTLRQHISMWVCQHISVNFHDTFFFFISLHNMWDLSSLTRDWTCAPAAEVQSLNHWTSREVPYDTSSQQS